MTPSRPVLLASGLLAICIVAVLGMFTIDPFGLLESSHDDRPQLGTSRWTEDFQERLTAVETQMRQLRATVNANSEAPPSVTAEETATQEEDGEALAARVASLESQLRVLETQVRALSEDPVSRGFEYVASENAGLRRRGINMLRRLARSDPQAVAAIRDLLDDPNPSVRQEAIEALAAVRDRESMPRILELLGDAESGVRREAIESLAQLLRGDDMSDPAVETAALSIADRLSDPERAIRRQAADSLGDFSGHAAVPALLQSLDDADDGVRQQAIDSLGDLRATAAVPRLRAIYDRDPGPLAVDLAIALRRLGDSGPFQKEVARLSEIAIASADEQERRQAVRQLGRFDASELRSFFEQALEDPSRRVREEAKEALEDLDD